MKVKQTSQSLHQKVSLKFILFRSSLVFFSKLDSRFLCIKIFIFVKEFGFFLNHGSMYAFKIIIWCSNCSLPCGTHHGPPTYNLTPRHHTTSALLTSQPVNAVSVSNYSAFVPSVWSIKSNTTFVSEKTVKNWFLCVLMPILFIFFLWMSFIGSLMISTYNRHLI